ncbi:YgaP family membrane protein [Thiolapillus sp.]
MKQNVGGIDKILRVIVGLAVIGWGVYAQNWWGALGAIPLFTGLMGWCPFYPLLKVSTKK